MHLLSFATEFPVNPDRNIGDFLTVVREWVLNSPHNQFVSTDLADIPETGEWSTEKGNERLEVLAASSLGNDYCGVRRVSIERQGDRELEWTTEIIFWQHEESWVSIRTSREANYPAYQLPIAKPPIIVKQLLSSLGGGPDGDLNADNAPYLLGNDDIDLATRLILGDAGCRLPVVYVSCGFYGEHIVDPSSLASDLAGLAHVVVEPNRAFSNRLQINVNSQNVYGGVLGIYWPEGAAKRTFFLPRDFDSAARLRHAIRDEVRMALLNRRPLSNVVWSAVREAQSQQIYASLKASGSVEVNEYVRAFDAELKAKNERLEAAESEIARLSRDARSHEMQKTPGSGVALNTGNERDYFPNEISNIVIDALNDANSRLPIDGRRHHVINAILQSNIKHNNYTQLRSELKDALRQYKSMDKRTRQAIESLGFSIKEGGKHYKLIYMDDDRYTFSIPKTGSDHRGGLNCYSDISKIVF